METLTVSETAKPEYVAHAITWAIRRDGQAQVRASGDKAVNQAMIAMALARSYLALDGLAIGVAPMLGESSTPETPDSTSLSFIIEPVTSGAMSKSLQRQLR